MKGKNEVEYSEHIPDQAVHLSEAKVIPDVIDNVLDTARVKVKYGHVEVTAGTSLTPGQTMEAPTIEISDNKTYTVVMCDPDAPSPDHAKYRSWLHWIVANIPAKDPQRGEEITTYMGPQPPKGRHRYVFLFYEQHDRVVAKAPHGRMNFQAQQWAKEHGLGDAPAAALYFYSEPE